MKTEQEIKDRMEKIRTEIEKAIEHKSLGVVKGNVWFDEQVEKMMSIREDVKLLKWVLE